MRLKSLREAVCEANIEMDRYGLAFLTFGNASGIDREEGVVAIKPSGVPPKELTTDKIVLVDLENNVLEGDYRPSSDTKTHTHLYRKWPYIGGVAHTHSSFATACAQSGKPIPCLGTTHADYVLGEIPCSEPPSEEQAESDYEENTGLKIVEALKDKKPDEVPMVLVKGHGPFSWGKDVHDAVYLSIVLEELAKIYYYTRNLSDGDAPILPDYILKKHFTRKHGPSAYYGQK